MSSPNSLPRRKAAQQNRFSRFAPPSPPSAAHWACPPIPGSADRSVIVDHHAQPPLGRLTGVIRRGGAGSDRARMYRQALVSQGSLALCDALVECGSGVLAVSDAGSASARGGTVAVDGLGVGHGIAIGERLAQRTGHAGQKSGQLHGHHELGGGEAPSFLRASRYCRVMVLASSPWPTGRCAAGPARTLRPAQWRPAGRLRRPGWPTASGPRPR